MFLSSSSFTLVELLVVLAVIAVLATVIVVVINPAELLKQFRDASRISDLASINRALNYVLTDCPTCFFGTSSVVYVSIPDSSPTCANLGLPSLPPGWSYACSDENNFRKVDGTGWIPVDFTKFSAGSPLPKLPVDPINSTSSGQYYTYVTGGSWKLTSLFESAKYAKNMNNDGGPDVALYETGTNLNLANFARGLVGYWSFDEGSGTTAYDYSGNNNHGTLTNGPTWTQGKVGGALSFDGVDDYVVVNNFNLSNTNKITISIWLRFSVSTLKVPLEHSTNFNYNNAFLMAYNEFGGVGSLQLSDHNSSGYNIAYTTGGYNNNQWHHFVAVSNRDLDGLNQITLYVDGNQNTIHHQTYRVDLNGVYSNYPLYFGSRGGSVFFFNGFIDEVRIYNRALSEAEIQAIYNATR